MRIVACSSTDSLEYIPLIERNTVIGIINTPDINTKTKISLLIVLGNIRMIEGKIRMHGIIVNNNLVINFL